MSEPNAEVAIVDIPRKTAGQTCIAHLSDLHLRAPDDLEANPWLALQRDLEAHSATVDLLVVSGDLVDNPIAHSTDEQFMIDAFALAREYVVGKLCPAAGVDSATSLLVVPGNHDYRTQGVMLWKRAKAVMYSTHFGRQYQAHRCYPRLMLACFLFDSNSDRSAVNFAGGLVQRERLVDFQAAVRMLGRRSDWHDLTKVAVLHHHPMPIGPTEHREDPTGRAEFVLLKNAGTFLAEIARGGVELVLHGHQHYPARAEARYPSEDGSLRTISVVGAGSATKGGHQVPASYHLITLTDMGHMLVNRRELTEASFKFGGSISLMSDETARNRRVDRLATRLGARLRISAYTRLDRITDRSGDDWIHERFNGVQPLGPESVECVEQEIAAKAGSFGPPEYTEPAGQRIVWRWLDGPEVVERRQGETHFDPPLQPGRPVSFGRKQPIFNAFYFNAGDRLAATEGRSSSESIRTTIRHLYGLLTIQAVFPQGRWPDNFLVEVKGPDGRLDTAETDLTSAGFSVLASAASVSLTVQKPLPGYTYGFRWELPERDVDDQRLPAQIAGEAHEVVTRLLHAERRGLQVQTSIRELRDEILSVDPFRSRFGDNHLELTLFCYDKALNGLVCVGDDGTFQPNSWLWSWVVKIGRGIVGQAYRRREEVICIQLPGQAADVYYEESPATAGPQTRHTVMMAVPLFFPLLRGRLIGVLSIASRSNTSGLLVLDEDKAASAALADHARAWFGTRIVSAFGFEPREKSD